MKNWIGFLVLTLVISGCNFDVIPKEEQSFTLNFSGKYGTDDLVLNEAYDFPNNYQMKFGELSFFISNVRLVDENDQEFSIGTADLVSFYNNHSSATASKKETISIDDVPNGKYKKIKFGIGLPADLNAKNPADYANDNPLSKTQYYWDWRATYIFSMVECTVDTLLNGSFDHYLTYHSGSDAMYKEVSFDTDFVIDNADFSINFVLDAKKIFVTDTVFDVKNNPLTHSTPDDAHIADEIITNLANAISVE